MTGRTKTLFEIPCWHKLAVEDDYEGGETGHPEGSMFSHPVSAPTREALLKQIWALFDCTDEEIEFDACEDLGRIDVHRMELVDGTIPLDADLQEWRDGTRTLFNVTYTGYLERVTRCPVSAKPPTREE